jgi:hypothetical protein
MMFFVEWFDVLVCDCWIVLVLVVVEVECIWQMMIVVYQCWLVRRVVFVVVFGVVLRLLLLLFGLLLFGLLFGLLLLLILWLVSAVRLGHDRGASTSVERRSSRGVSPLLHGC